MSFETVQHGSSPEHHAATLGGLVLELYPASARHPATAGVRIGIRHHGLPEVEQLVAARGELLSAEPFVVRDPDGQVVELVTRG